MSSAELSPGLVVSTHGRHCVVESPDGQRRLCHPRGKKSQVVVGDQVLWLAGAQGQSDEGTVEKILPRRNLFYRQDEIRTKSFAANLDQVLVLIAAEPEFSAHQLSRALVAAEAEQIHVLIGLNKRDLQAPFTRAWERLAPYREMNYPILPLALQPQGGQEDAHAEATQALWTALQGKKTLVLGPSGSGKSTLINRLVPSAKAATGEISQALNSGKHTTTSTTWYWVDEAKTTALIDSPGFQEFGLHHIEAARLASLMPDIAAHAGDCRFYNCSHLHEPGCAVMAALEAGTDLSPARYKIYQDLHAELSQAPRY
jgi:ribosome biogenesis GTPase / thiamine phosphate phosphatase